MDNCFKYVNPWNYIRRGSAIFNKFILGGLETWFAPDPDLPLRHPLIFFLGAPRSGSTLMTQVITDALHVGYMSNRHCQWFGWPALAERMFRPTNNKPLSDYCSRHGMTEGAHAPAECGQWWYRFFRRQPPYVTLHEVDPYRMKRFRQSIAALTNAYDRPILFKNLYASLRIQAIAKYVPESLFIVAHRDEVDNGHSILEARYTCCQDYGRWWSVEPPDVDRLKTLPSHEQVIEQIRHVYATIDRDLKDGGVQSSRRFDIGYEEFCSDPCANVEAFRKFLADNSCDVERIGHLPPSFGKREGIRIDRSLYDRMATYARRNSRR